MNAAAPKSPAVCITVTRATGPTDLCGKPRLFAGLDCWAKSEALLGALSYQPEQAFAEGAKHDFKIVFANGTVYDGTISCRDDDRNCDIRAHVLAQLNFTAGVRPAHLTEEDFALYQSMIPVAKRDAARLMLETHDI